MGNPDIAVSIYCNAYNHEKYIRKCLEGFVMQKTSFKFEILIHDDASTDSTPQIIKEFEEKYPDIMKPIYQTENQYSKRDGTISRIQHARVKGKYIAFCEGDDYWTDPLKLQKQYDALEAHPEIDMCGHAGIVRRSNRVDKISAPRSESCVIPFEEIILRSGNVVVTSSLMYRTQITKQNYEFRNVYKIDTSLILLGSLRGGLLYLNDCMSVYNFMNPGSWTRNNMLDSKKFWETRQRTIEMFKVLDEETDSKYHDTIYKKINIIELDYFYFFGPYKKLRQKKFRPLIKKAPFKHKIKILIKFFFPFLQGTLDKIKRKKERKIHNEQ